MAEICQRLETYLKKTLNLFMYSQESILECIEAW